MIGKGDYVLNVNNYPGLVLTDPDESGFVEVSSYSVQKHHIKNLKKLVLENTSENCIVWVIRNKNKKYLSIDYQFIVEHENIKDAKFFGSKDECVEFVNFYTHPSRIRNEEGNDSFNYYSPFEFERVEIKT